MIVLFYLGDIVQLCAKAKHKNRFTHPPPPTTHHKELLNQQYLSCYGPDFDGTLQVGSWEHLEQIPTVTVTFVQAIFVQATFVLVISGISQLLLTK